MHRLDGKEVDNKMRRIAILGSTGSIGTQTLDIVDKEDSLQVVALAAGTSVEKMEEQIRKYKPSYACMWEEKAAKELQLRVRDRDVKILWGMDGLLQIATLKEVDMVVTAVVGMIGIEPTVAAIKAGKDIALANKETLVTAGHIIMPLAKENGVRILPVDSEHSAIFQSLQGENRRELEKILLTASGGPFRGKKRAELRQIQVEDALKHPNWVMGRKITIDSSTLVNKGLEVMEAKWLFDADLDQIQVVVHPQSVIHSMVQYQDGAIIAQLGTPDMRIPIQYALFYPERRPLGGERMDFFKLGTMTFEKPDLENFPGLALAYQAAKKGGSVPTVYNEANERAVDLFLNRKLPYLGITDLIQESMESIKEVSNPSLEEILAVKAQVDEFVDAKFRSIGC